MIGPISEIRIQMHASVALTSLSGSVTSRYVEASDVVITELLVTSQLYRLCLPKLSTGDSFADAGGRECGYFDGFWGYFYGTLTYLSPIYRGKNILDLIHAFGLPYHR